MERPYWQVSKSQQYPSRKVTSHISAVLTERLVKLRELKKLIESKEQTTVGNTKNQEEQTEDLSRDLKQWFQPGS